MVVRRLPHRCRSGSRRARTTPTVRLRGQQALLPCTKVNPAIGLSWIVTGMASPARSSRYPIDARSRERWWHESLPRFMCVVRNVQASRTTHIGWERPVGPCMRRAMFAHIVQVEVVRCERRLTTGRRDLRSPRTPRAVRASSACDGQDFTDAASGSWAGG